MRSLLNVISCKNLSSVAEIVSVIWLLEDTGLVPNGCHKILKIEVFVIFWYFLSFLQIAAVDIF